MARRLLWLAAFVLAAMLLRLVPAVAQAPGSRFWLAGRYDGNHIVVYFNAVKFGDSLPNSLHTLPAPVTLGFLSQMEMPAQYISRFSKRPGAEDFHAGDQYDLLMGSGRITSVTLTTLVGYVSDDEEDDDDPSYIGALAKVDDASALVGTTGYYALERHDPSLDSKLPATAPSAALITKTGSFATLFEEPVRFDLQTHIAELLTARMHIMATAKQQRQIQNLAPTLAVQAIRLANGEVRYYARAEWRTGDNIGGLPTFGLGAWIAAEPKLRILAVEKVTSPNGFIDELPNLLNVVDLGPGRTGIIATIPGPGNNTLGLWEYRDGVDLSHMHLFQSIAMDE